MTQVMRTIKGEVNTGGNIGASALVTVKDLVIGVIGGGVVAAISGKYAIPIGVLLTGTGHYKNNKLLQVIGLGTMASNSFSKAGSVSGLEGLEGVKERLQAYKASMSERFLIDKILKKKSVSGIGEVQYFDYPGNSVGDLAALDSIEDQLIESGIQFQGTGGMGAIAGLQGDLSDVEDLNL